VALGALVYGAGRFSPVILVGYLLAMAWTAVLFTTGIRRNALPLTWVLPDVAVAVASAVIVHEPAPGPSARPTTGIAALTAAALQEVSAEGLTAGDLRPCCADVPVHSMVMVLCAWNRACGTG
jgi:hypothetical protein